MFLAIFFAKICSPSVTPSCKSILSMKVLPGFPVTDVDDAATSNGTRSDEYRQETEEGTGSWDRLHVGNHSARHGRSQTEIPVQKYIGKSCARMSWASAQNRDESNATGTSTYPSVVCSMHRYFPVTRWRKRQIPLYSATAPLDVSSCSNLHKVKIGSDPGFWSIRCTASPPLHPR
jgi:hypothetical protein